ncbi:MAG: hypothetical protein MR425_00340 [Lachnospiraceae bacterium]|nr:hypothetical protein [Lachnospiraceae bacterium]
MGKENILYNGTAQPSGGRKGRSVYSCDSVTAFWHVVRDFFKPVSVKENPAVVLKKKVSKFKNSKNEKKRRN